MHLDKNLHTTSQCLDNLPRQTENVWAIKFLGSRDRESCACMEKIDLNKVEFKKSNGSLCGVCN